MIVQEREHLPAYLQRRHIAVQVDPVQALDVQHRMTIQQLRDRDHVRHDDHSCPAGITLPSLNLPAPVSRQNSQPRRSEAEPRWLLRPEKVDCAYGGSGQRAGRSGGERADLDQVVGQDPVPGPDPGSFGAVQAGAVPAVAAFEGADPAFAAGPPLDGPPERGPVFGGLAGLAGFALARDDDVADPECVQVIFDGLLAVAAVCGNGPGLFPVRLMTRSTAGASCGPSAGLPCSRA